MEKELCIVHANCQGEPLIERLLTCPDFAARYDCRLFTNYTREPVADELLADCSLLLYQHLGKQWGDLASDALLAKLPDTARHLCIPNMFFTGYWPTWTGEKGFDYRCTYLDELIGLTLPPEEVIMLYLHTDMGNKFDLLSMAAESLDLERKRESHTPIKYLDIIRENSRSTRLFNTVNHPGPLLMDHAAQGVLETLGYTPDPAAMKALGDPFPEFEQPINPKVADFFGLDFGGPDQQYNIYGRPLSFARFVTNYVSAQRDGFSDFIGYLQGAYIKI